MRQLVVLDASDFVSSEKENVSMKILTIFAKAHKEKVLGVSLVKKPIVDSVVSCDENCVKLWSITDRKEVSSHSFHREEGKKVTCVDWSLLDVSIVLSGDDGGGIVVWNVVSNSARYLKLFNKSIINVKCSPQQKIAAISMKTGVMQIFSYEKKGKILQRLNHRDEVTSFTWMPMADEDSKAKDAGLCLCSCTSNKVLYVWGAKGGHQEGFHHIPAASQGDKTSKSCHCTIRSVDSNRVIHRLEVFNIAIMGNAIFTVSKDRNLIQWDIEKLESKMMIPTCGGWIYDISVSPTDPSRIAFACGDQTAKVWKSKTQYQLDFTTLYQGLRSKVTCVSWHPRKEYQLAIGTEDGRVGVFDVFNMKPPILSKSTHRKIVYSLLWAPSTYTNGENPPKEEYLLYSVGDSIIYQHSGDMETRGRNLQEVIDAAMGSGPVPARSDITWKEGSSILTIGNEDGTIEMFSMPHLVRLTTIYSCKRMIVDLHFHPTYSLSSDLPSKYSGWLAVASSEPTIHIIDCTTVFEGGREGGKDLVHLEGHTTRVIKVRWSPHIEGQLLSISFDGTARRKRTEERDEVLVVLHVLRTARF
ncbi:unnamed protein product [Darwinula stevensoni]|uniref:Gem-associated protein 5 second beta-propeller domain-containing protein n=1 Tax=Darwinula stevensoni TaxID=69355 RepID=A0A7R8XH34_9CRUS|nr:unnamed protein product [Darwinula stevensoni]CAG0893133.1 unnamed protein product [Darwinula stevensoni]